MDRAGHWLLIHPAEEWLQLIHETCYWTLRCIWACRLQSIKCKLLQERSNNMEVYEQKVYSPSRAGAKVGSKSVKSKKLSLGPYLRPSCEGRDCVDWIFTCNLLTDEDKRKYGKEQRPSKHVMVWLSKAVATRQQPLSLWIVSKAMQKAQAIASMLSCRMTVQDSKRSLFHGTMWRWESCQPRFKKGRRTRCAHGDRKTSPNRNCVSKRHCKKD